MQKRTSHKRINILFFVLLMGTSLVGLVGCAVDTGTLSGFETVEVVSGGDAGGNLVTSTPLPLEEPPREFIDGKPPQGLAAQIKSQPEVLLEGDTSQADLRIAVITDEQKNQPLSEITWVYAAAVPFPTVRDEVSFADIRRTWQGRGVIEGLPLMMSDETYQVFEQLWGPAAENGVQVVAEETLLEKAWEEAPSWAILPFEKLEPRWKVLRVDGISPLERGLNTDEYPLAVRFGIYPSQGRQTQNIISLSSNRDEDKLTLVTLTGTTALVRNTAFMMEENGISYPAEGIFEWLLSSDITHISNEVPFYSECPPAKPLRSEMRFCSSPAYIELLETIDVDLIELTGNHLMDWGPDAFIETLDLYNQLGIAYYGGGYTAEEAWKPYLITDHGNKLAFVGCNVMGPEVVWATDETPGSAQCGMDRLEALIRTLRGQGYLPVVTFQHFEIDDFRPQSSQRVDFQRMAQAGAVIVSGSQSHFPQTITFVEGRFVHYGLGNLFFDQAFGGHEREFIDRHIFYDGRHLSTELLTAKLTEHAQPVPMTVEERRDLLEDVFEAAVW